MLKSNGVKAVVLAGDLPSNISNEKIARKKVENFEVYRQLYPEYAFTFIGDSGQGDAMAGESMMGKAGRTMRGVFIHDVVNTPEAERAAYRERGVFMFDSYVDAATEACRRGLISRQGLRRVIDAAEADFAKIPFASDAQRQARRTELDAAKERARAVLEPTGS